MPLSVPLSSPLQQTFSFWPTLKLSTTPKQMIIYIYIYIYIYNQLIPWIWIFFKSYFKIILIISYYSIWKNCRFLGWIGNTTSLRAVSLYQWWDVFSGLLKFLCAYHLPPTYLHRYQVQGSFKSLTHTQKQKLFCQGAACFNNWKAWKTIED
jgi:hypothetical protein